MIKELLRAFGVGAAAVALLLVLFYHAISISANIWLSRWTDDSFLRNVSQAGRAEYKERTAMYVGVYAGLGILQGECQTPSKHWFHCDVLPPAKLLALVYDVLPSTTAVFSYAIGSRKLSANEQFLGGAQTVEADSNRGPSAYQPNAWSVIKLTNEPNSFSLMLKWQ